MKPMFIWLKGIAILIILLIVGIVLWWFTTTYENVFLLIIRIVSIFAAVFLIYIISENLYKFFDSWWGNNSPGLT